MLKTVIGKTDKLNKTEILPMIKHKLILIVLFVVVAGVVVVTYCCRRFCC